MFEINEETNELDFAHNPFSNIKGGVKAFEEFEKT
jgi:aspartyl-tRNA synthetase